MWRILISCSILVLFAFIPQPDQPIEAAGLVPTDYYLIAIGTSPGDTIGNAVDLSSGAAACTLRDAAEIVTAGTVAGPVTGCDITAIGSPDPANPVYVINYPASMVYTIDMTLPNPLDEIQIAFNPVHIIGTDPATDIIQGDITRPLGLGSRTFNFFDSDSTLCNLTLRYGDGRGREGATLINRAGELTLDNVRVYGSTTTGPGAGLANTTSGTMNIINGSIIGDQSEPNQIAGTIGAFGGAGILNWNSTLLIEDSTVHYNTTDQLRDGGGIYNTFGATVTLRNSTIANNTLTAVSNADGGGIFNDGELIVEGGHIHSNTTSGDGGGIYNDFSAELTISDGAIIGGVGTPNTASEGGGIFNLSFQIPGFTGFLHVFDAEISYNTTGRGGGGIFNDGGDVIIGDATRPVLIANNEAGSINGGGIHNEDGTLTITNSAINNNVALGGFGQGGGIYNAAITGPSTVLLTDSSLDNNQARIGGGLYNAGDEAVATLNNTFVTNNSTVNGGGGGIVNTFRGDVTIENGSIIGGAGNGNSSGFNGAGVFNFGSTLTITDSEVSFNIATDGSGGGIYNAVNIQPDPDEPSTATITNSRITDNQAVFGSVFNPDGGGIYNWESSLVISNTVIDDNQAADQAGGLLNEDGTVSVTGGSISGNSAGTDGGGVFNRTRFGFGNQVTSTTISGTSILDNRVPGNGGAIYNHVNIFGKTAVVTVDSALIGDIGTPNSAGIGGAVYNNSANLPEAASVVVTNSIIRANSDGFYHDNATTRVNTSCIEDNGAGFVNNTPDEVQDATNNWWGATDGPSDLGGSTATGSGDGVTAGVDFSGFYTVSCTQPTPPPPSQLIFNPVIQKLGALSDGGLGLPGDSAVWTITVTNVGDVGAADVVVTDTLPAALGITSVTTTKGTVSISGQTVTVDIGTLAPGETVVIRIETTILSSPADDMLVNTAMVSGSGVQRSATASLGVVSGLPDTGYPPE